MPHKSVHTFFNCASAIEELQNPQGDLDGRAFVIIDNESGEVWRFPMPLEIAQAQGQRLMGLGEVYPANGVDMKKVIAQHEGNKKQ